MKKATSKIKEVVKTKDYTNNYGTTIYHDLVMENGDKIQIGKKKLQQVGWELSYEIAEEGQHEFNPAKSIKAEEVPSQNKPTQNNPTGLNVQNLIIAQSCISSACQLRYHNDAFNAVDSDFVLNTAQKFYDWVIKKG